MIDPQSNKQLHRKYKRMMIFIGVFFVFAVVISYLLALAGLSAVLNGFIIICLAGIFYLLFLFICAKIDKKKDAQREKDKNRDPFSH